MYFLNFLHSMYKIWVVLLADILLSCRYLRLEGFGAAIGTHVLLVLRWKLLFILGSLNLHAGF